MAPVGTPSKWKEPSESVRVAFGEPAVDWTKAPRIGVLVTESTTVPRNVQGQEEESWAERSGAAAKRNNESGKSLVMAMAIVLRYHQV